MFMAQKYREEIVGKRFLALKATSSSSTNFLSSGPVSNWLASQTWITGIIRASSEKDITKEDIQVLVEFDNTDWQKREWLKIRGDYSVFLVEETLVLSQRYHPEKPNRKCWWPALTFKSVVDKVGIHKSELQPVEYLIDQHLSFVSPDSTAEYKEGDSRGVDQECVKAATQWTEYQRGQGVLVSTPTVIVGFRVKVYRTEGTTQWFTAVIRQYNDSTKELTLIDDTVLEEHCKSAELTQIIPCDGVVESILHGEGARIVPRRRACKEKEAVNKDQPNTSKDSSDTQSTQAISTSNQTISKNSKQVNQSATQSSVVRGGSARAITSRNKASTKTVKRPESLISRRDSNSSGKQQIASKKESKYLRLNNSTAAEPTRAHTSVIRRAPNTETRSKKLVSSSDSSVKGESKKDRQSGGRRAQSKKAEVTSASVDFTLNSRPYTPKDVTVKLPNSPSASSELDILTDMHIKKQRILGAVTDTNNGQNSHGEVVRTLDRASVDGSANSSLPPPLSTPLAQPAALDKISITHKADKLSESSIDGCSSGYSSAATNDSTVSPRDKDGHRIPNSGHPSMNTVPRLSNHQLAISTPTLSSTPTSVVSANPAAKSRGPSPLTSKFRTSQDRNTADISSPLVIDTSKDSPLVPYRDPELLKRDAEVRKMAHTPSGPQPPAISTSRSIPSATAAAAAGMPSLSQQTPSLPTAASAAAAAMLNPQIAAQQQLHMQQLMQQYQLLEQYRHLQAMQAMNPLQQLSLLQHHQMAAQAAAAQQQLAMGSIYDRQPRPSLPPTTPHWMMMPLSEKPLMSDLQREHELRAIDQKERAERAEREKIAKEKAEKERLEKEKERQQMQDRQERARILRESAQLAVDAVDQHFNESLRRMPQTTATPPMNAATMAMWNKKAAGYMGAGDSGQPQDLSINSKNKEQHRLDPSRLDPSRQEREHLQQQYQAAQAQFMASQNLNISEDKRRQQQALLQQFGSTAASSEAKLVDEHFMKAGLSRLPPKTEQAEYSLYGYQSQSFPHKYVSKDQLQQQLCKDEKPDIKPSLKSLAGKDLSKHSSSSRSTPPRTATSQPVGSLANYSNQLIQSGLIPNPAYTPHGTPPSSGSVTNTSNSIDALVNMSMYAGSHIADRYNKDKLPPVKSEPVSVSRSSQPVSVGLATPVNSVSASQPPMMKSFKSFVENAVTQAFYKDIEEQKKKESSPRSPLVAAAATTSVKSDKTNNGTMDTDSDTLSAPSPTLSVKTDSQETKPCHPKMKLKKEWLQRHAEGGSTGATSTSPTSAISGTLLNHSNMSNLSETTTSASETETEQQGLHKPKVKKRKSDTNSSTTNGQNKKTKNFNVSSGIPNKDISRSSGPSLQSLSGSGVWPAAGGDGLTQCSYNDEQDSIKQLADIALRADRMEAIPYANKPLVRVNITTLKRTLQSFVQDGSCIEMAPKLTKCRECKMTPNQRNKKMPNIFCRFYAFRMLKFSKNGQISIAGFCDPSEAEPDDITIWLPHISTKSRTIEPEHVKTAKYIIANVGEEFCRLVEQEQECINWSGNKRAWKRAVQGVREMCDVCDTTLFNTHWVCHRCGFVVCIDCYRVKRKIQTRTSNNVCEENRRWLSCTTNKNHEADKLMLTSIIPADALKIARDLIHLVRRKHNIKSSCLCASDRLESDVGEETALLNTNGVSQHLLDAAAVSKESLINGQSSADSNSKLSLSYPQDVYRQSTYLSASLDTKTLNTYSDDPLSLLADVASMAPSTNGPSLLAEVKINGAPHQAEDMDTDTEEKKPCLTLRKLLTKTQANGTVTSDKKVHDLVSTAVDPSTQSQTALKPKLGSNTHSLATTTNHEFAHYQRRSGAYLSGRSHAIPTCYLKETSMTYPDVKHSWLCSGKLLRLLDPQNPNNFALFNQRWTLGQPVIVSNVSKCMKVEDLWTPEAFSREFGHVRHDLIDCRRNEPLNGYQIKCFWDGFEDQSKRLTDAEGQPLILKLKDWPTAEDFAESMPSRFQDLMSALPLPQYTQRNGELNLAGRLPEFFVKPDLGPKMYIAYGLARYPQSGTTNLHLDVSDAVNVMVFVAHEEDLKPDVMKLIEDSDCDELMKRRIVEDGETPGALWHIYDACDADKMRDLLNKVALELGMELEPYHDPIHDQQFYLDRNLRKRLADEYDVHGYAILQCVGDAVFIPAGAPHQVQNLNGCIKVAEDFVSPEHLHHCFNLTQEFRHLSNTHSNHEDKLQVKNIIYHAIKDAVAVLDQSDPCS